MFLKASIAEYPARHKPPMQYAINFCELTIRLPSGMNTWLPAAFGFQHKRYSKTDRRSSTARPRLGKSRSLPPCIRLSVRNLLIVADAWRGIRKASVATGLPLLNRTIGKSRCFSYILSSGYLSHRKDLTEPTFSNISAGMFQYPHTVRNPNSS